MFPSLLGLAQFTFESSENELQRCPKMNWHCQDKDWNDGRVTQQLKTPNLCSNLILLIIFFGCWHSTSEPHGSPVGAEMEWCDVPFSPKMAGSHRSCVALVFNPYHPRTSPLGLWPPLTSSFLIAMVVLFTWPVVLIHCLWTYRYMSHWVWGMRFNFWLLNCEPPALGLPHR